MNAELSRLYQDGDSEFRTRVVQAVLEQLFEKPEVAGYFKDWQLDPVLKVAYAEAMMYAEWMRDYWRRGGRRE